MWWKVVFDVAKDVLVIVAACWSALAILIYTVLSVVQGDEFVVSQQFIAMGISVPVLWVTANLVYGHFSNRAKDKRDAEILSLLREQNALLERLTTAIENFTPQGKSEPNDNGGSL